MPRGCGDSASMAAWTTDYLAYRAGCDGMVRHTKMSFRDPAFEGDVTYLDGVVTARQEESASGVPIVAIPVP